MRLKADLHVHTADDRHDRLGYSSEMLIDEVAQLNLDVLAIACHGRVVYTAHLAEYARRRGVLLVPAIETLIEGKHVVLINPDPEQAAATTFDALRALGRRNAVILAPHPFYPAKACLREALIANIDLFDAIEYSCFYYYGCNPNRKAVRVAKQYRRPLIGTSDTHILPYSGRTFSWIEAEEARIEAVIDALRAGHVEVVTAPPPWASFKAMFGYYAREFAKYILRGQRL